jgi:NADPH-dependent 7-cyano-7-deazaguanine reductase QueF
MEVTILLEDQECRLDGRVAVEVTAELRRLKSVDSVSAQPDFYAARIEVKITYQESEDDYLEIVGLYLRSKNLANVSVKVRRVI